MCYTYVLVHPQRARSHRRCMQNGAKAVIFVGSSTEGLEEAHRICELLTDEATECMLWDKAFPPGFLTLESLEHILLECCAAVFVATPDDEGTIRGVQLRTPRANILLEFGLMAGRLGRPSIALCQYGCVELPSDLKGLTVIKMDPDPAITSDTSKEEFRQRAYRQLHSWSSHLVATAERIPRTEIVHGYTGRWRFNLQLDTWRNLPIAFPSYALVNGFLDLWVNDTGQKGKGFAHGSLTFKLVASGTTNRETYLGEIRVCHQVTHLFCSRNGNLQLTTETFSLHRLLSSGEPWPEIAGVGEMPDPWPFYWKLHTSCEPRTLEGSVCTEGSGKTEGNIRALKEF